jgi:hypothetical protein
MSEQENESTRDSESSVEDQLTEITEFEHKIRLLRWGMVVGTLLIIALGVINIINKVNRTLEPAKQIVADAKVILPEAQETIAAIQNITVGGDRFDKIAENFRKELGSLEHIPDEVAESAKDKLVKILNDRDDKLRELFPDFTKDKMDALLAGIAKIADERGDEVLISLFADHIHEVDGIHTHLATIQKQEAHNIDSESNMQAGLMLASNVLDLLVTTVNDLKANIDDRRIDR